jgi:8-hydroxy-5-deazaflavin:NADPH oxidoreductase
MKIGVLGSGEVGRTLGSGLVALGHQVMMGTRNVAKPEVQEWLRENGSRACIGSFAEAAAFGDPIFFCIRWSGAENAITLAGNGALAGKVVVDVTNPIDFRKGIPPRSAIGSDTSAGQKIQQWLPASRIVKALNTLSAKHMIDGRLGDERLDMFIAGNDDAAKKSVEVILEAWHWNVHDLGGIEQSILLESFALLSILHGFRTNRWDHLFKLVYRR